MRIEAWGRSECGEVRDNNEDAWLADAHARVFVVADGMGGHAAGEIASEMAVRCLHDILSGEEDPDETHLMADVGLADPDAIMQERLRYAMNQASVRIQRIANARPETRGMGTTAVVAVVDSGRIHLAHVGDSRAYRVRDGVAARMTRDHTVVQDEIDAGRLTPQMARLMPQRGVLTRSVGFHGRVEPDVASHALEPGDLWVLCSDGVTDVMDDGDLGPIVASAGPEHAADALVREALARDTQDNSTVVVVYAAQD